MYMDNIIEIVSIQVLSAHMEKQQQKDSTCKQGSAYQTQR